jgi:hypothetical protein
VGRKYKLAKLTELLNGKVKPKAKHYQPYEIRAFLNGKKFLAYLTSDLIKNCLIKTHGVKESNKIVEWFKPLADEYTNSVK